MGILQRPQRWVHRQKGQVLGVWPGLCLEFVEMQTFSVNWGWQTTLQNSTANFTAEGGYQSGWGARQGPALGFQEQARISSLTFSTPLPPKQGQAQGPAHGPLGPP